MKFTSVFEYNKLPFNTSKDFHLLLKVTAPSLEIAKRKPVSIITLVDTSGSMGGAKIDYTKKSLLKMIDNLQPGDSLGIVTFDHQVKTLLPLTEITDDKKASLRTTVGKLTASGSTDLYSAIMAGYEMAKAIDGEARIILFTDGEPTTGITSASKIVELSQGLLKSSPHTLSCFGYGDGHDAKLLTDLSINGKGNYVYITGPDEALVAFGRELGGLLSRYGSDIQIKLEAMDGLEILSVRSDLDVEQNGKIPTIKIPDIYGEETKKVLISARISAREKFLPREVSLAKAEITFKKYDGNVVTEKANVLYAFAKNGSGEVNDEVLQQIDLVNLLNSQKAAEEAARRGDFTAARSFMSQNVYLSSNASAFKTYTNNMTTNSYSNHMTYASTAHSNAADMSTLRSARLSGTGAQGPQGPVGVAALAGVVESANISSMVDNFTQGIATNVSLTAESKADKDGGW